MDTNGFDHCRIVHESIAGIRAIDEQVLDSVSELAQRLERLRKTHRAFLDIEFSPQLQAITSGEMALAVS